MSEQTGFIEQVHASGRQLVMAVTGGGSGAISTLLEVPGASKSVLEALVPYSARSLEQWLGGQVEQYCSEKTARAMAMRAFERARELSDADPRQLCGIGATASLASNRPKRGAHRIHAAWQSATSTVVTTWHFESDSTRRDEEQASTRAILQAVGEACGVPVPDTGEESIHASSSRREQLAPRDWTELLLGQRNNVSISGTDDLRGLVLFPGAFNPPHWGHERMAEYAERRYGKPVTFEVSVINVDKPPLDFIEIADRLGPLANRPVLLTHAATFVEKARLAPGCTFIVGVDTIVRVADPIYYAGEITRRDAAIAEMKALGCGFLVFGRALNGEFKPLSSVEIPGLLREMCEEVSESEFSADVSSTALRQLETGSS